MTEAERQKELEESGVSHERAVVRARMEWIAADNARRGQEERKRRLASQELDAAFWRESRELVEGLESGVRELAEIDAIENAEEARRAASRSRIDAESDSEFWDSSLRFAAENSPDRRLLAELDDIDGRTT